MRAGSLRCARLNAPHGAGCFLMLLRLPVGLRAPLDVVMHLMALGAF